MKLSRSDIGTIAENLLVILEREGVSTATSLKEKVGKRFDVEGEERDHVEITERPSNFATKALTCSYIREGVGIPIEIRLNPHNYTKIIIKLEEEILVYVPWTRDPHGNIVQDKIHCGTNFQGVKAELEQLRMYRPD